MGVLKQQGTEQCFPLGPYCLIGRHPECNLRVNNRRISGGHAELRWRVDHWALHDLGSSNGTFLDGRRLDPAERAPLPKGATFVLGTDLGFTLIDDGPPMLGARNERTGAVRTATTGMLFLPDDEHPEASVFEDVSGQWVVEDGDSQRRIRDGQEITAGGDRWTISLPGPSQTTEVFPSDDPFLLEHIAVRLTVSRNLDHVGVTVRIGSHETKLPAQNPFQLLLLLAEERLKEGGTPTEERGWIDRDELCGMLGTTTQRLNVEVFRVRQKFEELGVRGAPNIIERRPGDLRLGIDRVEVVKL